MKIVESCCNRLLFQPFSRMTYSRGNHAAAVVVKKERLTASSTWTWTCPLPGLPTLTHKTTCPQATLSRGSLLINVWIKDGKAVRGYLSQGPTPASPCQLCCKSKQPFSCARRKKTRCGLLSPPVRPTLTDAPASISHRKVTKSCIWRREHMG